MCAAILDMARRCVRPLSSFLRRCVATQHAFQVAPPGVCDTDEAAVHAEACVAKQLMYHNENGDSVMTAHCHLTRGFCCGKGCRHCPYGHFSYTSERLNRIRQPVVLGSARLKWRHVSSRPPSRRARPSMFVV